MFEKFSENLLSRTPFPRGIFIPLFFFAVALIIYSPSLGGEFLVDDYIHIVHSAPIDSGFQLFSQPFFHAPGSGEGQYYRPLVFLTYRLIAKGLGINPVPFHLFNLIIHSLNASLLFAITLRILKNHNISLAVALFFFLHPLQVEEVAYISGLGGLVASACMFFGLWLWLQPSRSRIWPALAMILGLLYKESVLIFPVLLFIFILISESEKSRRSSFISLLPLGGITVIYLAGRQFLLPNLSLWVPESAPWLETMGGGMAGVLETIRSIFIPEIGHFYHSIPSGLRPASLIGAMIYLSLLVILLAGCLGRRRVSPAIASGTGWFLLGLFPFLGLRPLFLQRGSLFWGDHFSYFALAGVALALGGVARLCQSRGKRFFPLMGTSLILIAGGLSGLSWQSCRIWNSELEVALRCAQYEPELFRARAFLAEAYIRQGRHLDAAHEYRAARIKLAKHTQGAKEENYLPFEASHLRKYMVERGYSLGRGGDLLGAAHQAGEALLLFPEDPRAKSLLERVIRAGQNMPGFREELPPPGNDDDPAWELVRKAYR